jgi:alkylation response protein AidB-like acyl-CoA dehydrogenase
MAKVFSADTAMKVTTDAVQILGGVGYTKDYPVERMMRDAKATQIYEGTNQVQRIVIARDIFRKYIP